MSRVPVVFIRGLWLRSASWDPWVDYFAAHGFDALAPGWPQEPATMTAIRDDSTAPTEVGLEAVMRHYARIVGSLTEAPVLIGHSVGGLIAQKLLGTHIGRAAVAIAPACVGQAPSLRSCPQLCSQLCARREAGDLTSSLSLTVEQFRYAVASIITEQESAALFQRYAIPSPGRLLLDLVGGVGIGSARAAVNADDESRGPLLLISAQEDRMVPDAVTRATYRLYGDSTAVTTFKQFADRAHSLTIDSGWRTVADYVLAWLNHQGIPHRRPGPRWLGHLT
ncbi:alpha/beta hydrolase [Streptomyces nigra]|uniref:alpha/beta hydrolase n=1 Tax=Streptomyces nigra TaxID=1827580 RepID=UPI00368FE611